MTPTKFDLFNDLTFKTSFKKFSTKEMAFFFRFPQSEIILDIKHLLLF